MKILMISRPNLYDVPGGDTVQIVETAKAIRENGIEVVIKLANENIHYTDFELIHFFNIIRPNTISAHVKKSNLPFVISTIFVDYSEIEQNYRSLPFKLLSRLIGADGLDYLKTIGRAVINGQGILDYAYLWRGHKKSIEQLLNKADLLLPNSHSEFKRLQKRYSFQNKYLSIPNAVSNDFFSTEVNESAPRMGVLCIARIEFIKNQLNLIKSLKGTNINLKLIGKPAPNHLKYFEECKKEAGSNIQFMGQLNKEAVIAELKKTKVHVLPSFFETTGLSSLEAAAIGCNVVITEKGDTKEYFEDLAYYCSPNDPTSIRSAIEKALNAPVNPQLKQRIFENYRWEITAKKTISAYLSVLNKD
jgi:glycosyltransferase involved in cell wall biosynthesis